jgi:hypothetical protein
VQRSLTSEILLTPRRGGLPKPAARQAGSPRGPGASRGPKNRGGKRKTHSERGRRPHQWRINSSPARPSQHKLSKLIKMQFSKVILALATGAAAFTAPTARTASKVVVRGEEPMPINIKENRELGSGGMADTRDPEPFVNESDSRQSISQAPSFEEYLKSRQ